jgi:hypothetical protein
MLAVVLAACTRQQSLVGYAGKYVKTETDANPANCGGYPRRWKTADSLNLPHLYPVNLMVMVWPTVRLLLFSPGMHKLLLGRGPETTPYQ